MNSSRIMRPFIIVLSVALIFFLSFFILSLFIRDKEPQPAPDIVGVGADGQTLYALSDQYGERGIALVFFGLDHRHSQEVMQRIVPQAEKEGVLVVAVCTEVSSVEQALQKMKELKIPQAEITLFDLDGEMAKEYNVTAAPCTYFIDKSGNILDAYLGTISEKSIEKELQAIA